MSGSTRPNGGGTLTIDAAVFKQLVSPVMPMADVGSGLPVLNCVRIEARGDYLVAAATDRFRLGMQRIKRPTDCPPEWTALIPLAAIKSILSTFAPRRGQSVQMSLIVADDFLRVEAAGAMLGGFLDAAFRWPLETGEFPKVWSLVTKTLDAETVNQPFGLNPKFMGDFAAASGRGVQVHARSGRLPYLVTTSDGDFLGLIMPRTMDGDGFSAESWGAMFAEATVEAPVAPALEPVSA